MRSLDASNGSRSEKPSYYMVESNDAEVRHEGTTVDMSEHGARVESDATLTPGQTLSLIQPDDPTHALRCLVI